MRRASRRKEKFHFDIYEKDEGGYAGVALQYIRAMQTGKPVDMILCVPNQARFRACGTTTWWK